MKTAILVGVAALAMIGAAPASAQAYGGNGSYNANGGWNRDAFWRGAPASARDRIAFLQRRIQRGAADGTLDRREARQAQIELNDINRDARRGSWNNARNAVIQQRLDALSQRLRWSRQNNRNGGGYGNGGYGNGGYGNGGGYGDAGRPDGYYAGNDPRFRTDYDARSHYRPGPNYSERRLSAQDEVYRGSDGQYYCKRNDGTTGLIVGGIGGAGVGNIIDGGHKRTAGTLIGGALGALLGKSIDQNSDVRCR